MSTAHPITGQILARTQQLHIEVQLPDSVEDKWQAIEDDEVTLAIHTARLGYRYMDLKETLGHGEFLAELKGRGICERKVQRFVSIAKLFIDSDKANTTTLSHLKPTQVLELTKLPDEKKQQLTPETIEEYGHLSVRNLRAVVKQEIEQFQLEQQSHDELAQLKAEHQTLNSKYADMVNSYNQELMKKDPGHKHDIPPFVQQLKMLMPEISQHLHENTTKFTNQFEQLTNSILDQEHISIAAQAMYAWMLGPYQQMGLAMHRLAQLCEQQGVELEGLPPVYTEQQWLAAESKRQTIIDLHNDKYMKRGKA